MDVHHGVVAALGKDVDEHGQRLRFVENRVLAVDVRVAGKRMPRDDRHHLLVDERDDPLEELGFAQLVAVEALDQFLAGVDDDLAGERQGAQAVEGAWVELERALILEFPDNVLLDLGERALGVDQVVVEDILEGKQRFPRLLLEHAVAAAGELLLEIRDALLHQLAGAGTADLVIVQLGLAAALELPAHTLLLVHEEDDDLHDRLAEMLGERRAVEFAPKLGHLFVKHLQALDLRVGPGETVEDDAVAELRLEQPAEEHREHLAVADHVAGVLDLLHLRRVEERAHDDGQAGEAAGLGDEGGVGAFAGAGRAAEEDDLLREAQVLAPEVRLQVGPDRLEDDPGVIDLQIRRGDGGRDRGGGFQGLAHVRVGGA